MRLTRDLRITADQIDMGMALAPMIEAFAEDGQRRVPMGKCWNAFEDLLHELERAAIDRMSESPHTQAVNGIVARLLGSAPTLVPLGAEDFARLEGYREALRAVKFAVAGYVEQASRPKAEAAKKQGFPLEQPRVGRSRL